MSDPVAAKELRTLSRRWQMYVGRCIYVGLTAYILYSFWNDVWRATIGRPATVSVSEFAVLGREIFDRCQWIGLGLSVLGAAMAGADMVTREIRSGTLGLLLLTPLTPRRVILGKMKGALLIGFTLYLCSLPVQAIAVYLGGVGVVDLIRSSSFTLSLTCMGAALAIYFSTRLKSTGAAVAATLPTLLVSAGFLLLVEFLVQTGVLIVRPKATRAPILAASCASATVAIVYALFWLEKAVQRLRDRSGSVPGPAELAQERRALDLQDLRDQRNFRPVRVLRTWRAVWEDSPLLWKEFTLRPALRIREDWRTRSYIVFFTLFIASWVASIKSNDASNVFFMIWSAFFLVAAMASGSMLFAPEKEGRQWTVLLSTPISPSQIVRAKLVCGLIFPEVAGMVALYLMALLGWVGARNVEALFMVACVATLFILFAYAVASAASLRAGTARGAFLFAAAVVAFLVTAPPLFASAARPLRAFRGPLWNEFWFWIEALDPVLVLQSLQSDEYFRRVRFDPGGVAQALRFAMLYLPATLLLPVDMILRFRRVALQA